MVRRLRREAHRLAEAYFGDWDNQEARRRMYQWVGRNTKSGHIGKATEQELNIIIKLLRRKLNRQTKHPY